MSSTTPIAGFGGTPGESVAFAADTALPLRVTDFDAGLAGLLHGALHGARRSDLLNGLCKHLARAMHLRLAVLAHALQPGSFAIDGTSTENALWLELQRIPERWDSGVSSHGPAGEAMRAHAPVRMRLLDDGFALWRSSAEAEHVREILALPVPCADGTCILELYFDGEIARGASTGTLTAAQLVQRVATFLTDLRTIERQQLLANALAGAGHAALITDLEGTIVWTNSAFSSLSGYQPDEVIGRTPSLLRSGEQGLRYYRELWGTIRAGEVWSGETIDRAKNGQNYAIQQTVSPVSQDGRITHYLALQQDIRRQRKERLELERATRLSPGTGLLTRAAFEDAARKALTEAESAPVALVLVSLRGLQRAAAALGEEIDTLAAAGMGARVHEDIVAPDLAGCWRPYEYALLLRSDVTDAGIRARLKLLMDRLKEPLPYLASMPDLDPHFGIAATHGTRTTYEELRQRADRQLADEPYRRARRETH